MRSVLITGMSGTGKFSVIRELAALGYIAIDTDYGGWCVPPDGSEPTDDLARPGWIWDTHRMRELLVSEHGEVRALGDQRMFEPVLRRRATIVIDNSAPMR